MPNFKNVDTALVLLHGFCEDKSIWGHIIPELKFSGRIITPNLPGFGGTELNLTNFSITDIADAVHSDLMNAGIKNYICIGHSLGGYITLALKNKFASRVTKIGLLHSTSFEDTPDKKNTRNKLIEFLDKHPASTFLSSFVPSLFAEANKERLKTEIKQVIDMSKDVGNKTLKGHASAMRDREDFSALLYKQEAPLFIAGKYDTAILLEDSEKQIANIKNKNNCHILENTAHMGMYESPTVIIKAINQFTSNNQVSIR